MRVEITTGRGRKPASRARSASRIANGIAELRVQNDSDPVNDSARYTVTVSKEQEVRTRVSAEETVTTGDSVGAESRTALGTPSDEGLGDV